MFKCRTCPSKDAHISDLKEQISLLRALVYPRQNKEITREDLERDALLGGEHETIHMVNDHVNDEAALILSGNYDDLSVEI